jgi:hypothetical protein
MLFTENLDKPLLDYYLLPEKSNSAILVVWIDNMLLFLMAHVIMTSFLVETFFAKLA